MALPPSLAGSVQSTITSVPGPPGWLAVTPVGAPGTVAGVDGVTELEGADGPLVPTAFVAVTVKVYEVPFVRPLTVQPVPAVEQVKPPGDEVAVYPVMGLPPSLPADQLTFAVVSPAVALTEVGAPGAVAGVPGMTAFEGPDGSPVPTAFVAVTVNV